MNICRQKYERKYTKMTRRILAMLMAFCMMLALTACGGSTEEADVPVEGAAAPAEEAAAPAEEAAEDAIPGLEDGVLTIAMECAYAPYNWTQYDDANGAVPIAGTDGEYANGYDVMIAKMLCEANGWELEIIRTDWDSLVPGVQSGLYDAVIAGQSMTEERSLVVDFAGPYFYASIVCLTRADSEFADAQGLADLAGGSCTAQIATIWYDSMLSQIPDADIQTAAETAPAMLMALETGAVDFVCTDMPTALGACAAYEDFVLLDFTASEDNFEADEGEINIGISLQKGNTALLNAINAVLGEMDAADFNVLMDEAIAIQPLSE